MRLAATLALVAAARLLPAGGQSDEVTLHSRRAQAAIQQNHTDEAIRELQALLRADPGNVNAIASLGMVEFTKGDYAGAAERFEAALKRSPSLWSAGAFLGMCEMRLGQRERGQQLLEQSFPHVTDKNLRIQAGLALVQSYSGSAMLEKAQPILEALRQADPANAEVLYATYRLHSEIAAAALRKLTLIDNDSLWIHEILAQNYMAQELYGSAILEYRKALQRDAHAPGLHYQLGEALFSEARTEQNRAAAEKEFLAELENNPADADSLNKLGEIALERSDTGKATKYFTRAIELKPGLAEGHAALAGILENQGDRVGAITHFEAAARLAPDVKTTHYRLAQLYKVQGRASDSEREFALFRKLSGAEAGSPASTHDARP